MATIESNPAVAFPYGWRYVRRTLPEGGVVSERVPLTRADLLHPQEGDQVTHNDLHQRICLYLYNVLCGLVAHMADAVVLQDVRIAWDSPDLAPHGPDVMVIFGVRERKHWSTFDVAAEGVRPALIIEVTSPETRSIDLIDKLEEYDLAGVPLYIIIDLVQRRGIITPRLLGYRQTPTIYEVLTPDANGRLWIEPLGIWLGLDPQSMLAVCYDSEGTEIKDYVGLQQELRAELQARNAAERRIQELEAEIRRLRGEA